MQSHSADPQTTRTSLMLLFGALATCVACSGSDQPGDPQPGDDASPLYVVSTRVTTAEGESLGYLATVPALDGRKFELDRAIETTVGLVYADRERGFLYHASNREPLITRWKVMPDGKLDEPDRLSFANLGYESVGAAAAPFYAHDKAYFVQGSDLVIWNPEAMEIVGTLPLEVENDGMLRPWLTLFQRQDRLFVTVYWERDFSEDYSIFGDHTDVLEIDPATDTVIRRFSEPRCNQLDTITSTSDGTAYFSSNAFSSPLRALLGEGHGVDSCALRIVPRDRGFDEGYELKLPSLTGGRQAGDFGIVDDQTAILRVWHPELVSELNEDQSNWQDILGENGHLWWRWTIGEPEATLIPNQQPGAYGGEWYEVDGRLLLLQAEGDFSESTLLQLHGDALELVLTGPGYIFGAARVR